MKHFAVLRSFLPVLALALAGLLASCNQSPPTGEGAGADTAATATTRSAEALAAAAAAAAGEGAAVPADAAAPERAPVPDPATTAAAAEQAAPSLVEGVDYELIRGGQPYEPLNGK